MGSQPDNFIGPITSHERSDFVAYVLRLEGIPSVGVIAHLDDHGLLLDNFSQLAEGILGQASRTAEDWRDLPVVIGLMQPGGRRLEVHVPDESDPVRAVEQFLETMRSVSIREAGGRRYVVTEYVPEGSSDVLHYKVQPEDGDISQSVIVTDKSKLDLYFLLQGELKSEMDRMQTGMYAFESSTLDDPHAAFRSYYYASVFVDAEGSSGLAETGLQVVQRLLARGAYDYAEWVGATAAKLAESGGDDALAAAAYRWAGIAASALGRFEETRTHFARAVARLEADAPRILQIRVHMSHGLALIDLFAHWEAENDPSVEMPPPLQEDLATARAALARAAELAGPPADEADRVRLCAIELDDIRAVALAGDDEGALERLDELRAGERFVATDKLVATALFYRAAALRRLASGDLARRPEYLEHLETAHRELSALDKKPGDRACCFYTLFADAQLEEGRPDRALEALQLADAIQEIRGSQAARPPSGVLIFGGIPAIDLAGRLQEAHALAGSEDPRHYWKAMTTADAAKGRFFRRDLSFAAFYPQQPSAYESDQYRNVQALLREGRLDPRILIADFEWFCDRDLDSEAAAELRERSGFEHGLHPRELESLFGDESESTAFVSFYATRRQTWVYVQRRPDRAPDVALLPIDLATLERCVESLHAGIAGGGRRPPIDPADPGARQRFFQPFEDLRPAFEQLVPLLEGRERIVISPHGLWHGLPLHALLLPAFWQRGLSPAVVYAPSLHGLCLLGRRAAAKNAALRAAGLAAVPAAEDPEAPFRKAWQAVRSVFDRDGRPVRGVFGSEATVERVLEDTRQVGVHHLLAHGRYEADREAMRSALLLADGSELPSRALLGSRNGGEAQKLSGFALMAAGTRADHVTLQACSIGRVKAALGDELWGVSRALLAAGADSVLAPLWSISLRSSTSLLVRFYESWLIDGRSKATALAEAQRSLAMGEARDAWRHFFHWAPFQLVGFDG